jgi:hypothetical protein
VGLHGRIIFVRTGFDKRGSARGGRVLPGESGLGGELA